MKLIILFLTLLNYVLSEDCTPYDSFPNHTMCIYKEKACEGKVILRSGGLTRKEKFEILFRHNTLRNSLVEGKVWGQPKAANMSQLVWDKELARIAQRFADQCVYGNHDKMRNVPRFKVGQNIHIFRTDEMTIDTKPNITPAIVGWWNEVYNPGFPPENIDPFVWKPNTGHYTQLAWAVTEYIGCGFTMYTDIDKTYIEKLFICNYGPRGNVLGKSMYIKA